MRKKNARGEPLRPLSHNNSQYILAIVGIHGQDSTMKSAILEAFGKTAALPCDIWRDTANSSVTLASNYPDCILESSHFCIVCAGFPYHYQAAFATSKINDSDKDGSDNSCDNSHPRKKSFAKTILDFCEAFQSQHSNNTILETKLLPDQIGRRLKRVSGHFSVIIVAKRKEMVDRKRINNFPQLWTWNDPFGFLPIYHCTKLASTIALSNRWDCLIPAIMPSRITPIDWDVVAEYLSLGTTLGGSSSSCYHPGGRAPGQAQVFDQTFFRDIYNLKPGTLIHLSLTDPTTTPQNIIAWKQHTSRYVECYGACEELLSDPVVSNTNTGGEEDGNAPTPKKHLVLPPQSNNYLASWCAPTEAVQSVRLAEPKQKSSPPTISDSVSTAVLLGEEENHTYIMPNSVQRDQVLMNAMFHAICRCVEEALDNGFVTRAALTGGGDTRMILACLLLLQQQKQQQRQQQQQQQQPEQEQQHHDSQSDKDAMKEATKALVFQTHSKQATDWYIARHLARIFRLRHERIQVTATTMDGYRRWGQRHEEQLLSNLHDQTPMRRRQRRPVERYREDVMTYTLHGRFGTEFLGCLCFDKSPLDIRNRNDLDSFGPIGTRRFEAMFRRDNNGTTSNTVVVRNPVDTLCEVFRCLEEEKEAFDAKIVSASSNNNDTDDTSNNTETTHSKRWLAFDLAFAFQLQLFTRAGLSDIYKGLRGGSWFSIPTAQFTRNAITPFLDNHLLRLLLCCVPSHDKDEPYQLYGRLYQTIIPDSLLKVPSNNKLLCSHTEIPRALKVPEKKTTPFIPNLLSASRQQQQQRQGRWSFQRSGSQEECKRIDSVHDHLQTILTPVFWKGAISIILGSPSTNNTSGTSKLDIVDAIAKDQRPEVQALVHALGESAAEAALLSGRLQSFLLWYERRFLPHTSSLSA